MEIKFIEENHEYRIDGVVVPSVSKLIKYALGDAYKDIPDFILEKAKQHGTAVHEAIEEFEKTGEIDPLYVEEVEGYEKLRKKYLLEVKDMEQIVHYENHYCGRYDIRDAENTLWDIKATSKVNKEYLEWQLGLYYLALGIEKEIGYCIHVPKKKYGKPKVVLIKPKSNKECIDLIKTYEQSNTIQH